MAPVVFVHGYCGSERVWSPLRAALSTAGFNCLIALCYNAITSTVDQVADRLADEALRAMDATGAPGVHLIGHSLGGLVVREAVQRRGLAAYTPRGRHHRNAARGYLGRPIRARAVRSADAARITLSHRTGRHRVQRRATLVGAAGAGRSGGPAAIRHARRRRAAGGDPSTQRRRTSLDHRARRRRAVDRLRTRPVRPPLATGPRHRVRRSPGFARTAGPRVRGPCGRSGNRLNHRERRPPTAFLAGVACGHRLRADRRTPSRCADSIRHGPG